jgi:lipopolysaccharide/colanic/teichoic acid biosynthesis glycosyltransferase
MAVAGLRKLMRKLLGRSGAADADWLLAPPLIKRILERERARADRTNEPLAMIVFAPATSREHDKAALELVQVLRNRIRLTDVCGWLSDNEICVVLPGTHLEGARSVADSICELLSADTTPPPCTIYVYPNPGEGANGEAKPYAEDRVAVACRANPPTAEPLEQFLARPMPVWKRMVDILGAGAALILFAPLMLLIAVAIKATSRGPVVFRQRRSGLGGRPFQLYKFRTMVADAEARKADLMQLNEQDGPAFKIRNDPRITRVGRFLRRTSLDELPQLWNVLLGDMSLVGPRPLPCHETAACEGWQRQRLNVTPGITCIWQIFGRSSVSFDDWIRMDVQYIRSRSVGQDVKLLLQTVPAVLLGRGAH